MSEFMLALPTYIVPLAAVLIFLMLSFIPAIIGIIVTTFEIGWIMRKKKFGESEQDYISRLWSMKDDDSILSAYEDATGWVDLSMGIMKSKTVIEIADDCFRRLETYILPEMKKRGLSYV